MKRYFLIFTVLNLFILYPESGTTASKRAKEDIIHTVRVASFKKEASARKMMLKLKEEGYPAGILRIKDTKIHARKWYTVYLGFFEEKNDALRIAGKYETDHRGKKYLLVDLTRQYLEERRIFQDLRNEKEKAEIALAEPENESVMPVQSPDPQKKGPLVKKAPQQLKAGAMNQTKTERLLPSDDLLEIYKLALKRDPGLKSFKNRHQASMEGLYQAYSSFFPSLALDGQYIDTSWETKSGDSDIYGSGASVTKTYSVTLSQPVFHYDYFVNLKKAKTETRRSERELAMTVQDLIMQVVELYLGALAAQDNLDFALSEQAAVEQHFILAGARAGMGLAPHSDLYDVKARVASVKASTIRTRNELDHALQALRTITDRTTSRIAPLKMELSLINPDPDDADAWVTAALKQNILLDIRRYEVEAAKQEVNSRRAGHFPSVDLVARINNNEPETTQYGGSGEVETREVLLQFNMPVFQGGYVRFKTREAIQLLKATVNEQEKQRREVIRQTRMGYLGIKSAIRQAEALEQSIDSYKLALDTRREGFKTGLFTSVQVLDAERDLYLAKRYLAKARYDYILDTMRLKQAAGILSENDIIIYNEWFAKGDDFLRNHHHWQANIFKDNARY